MHNQCGLLRQGPEENQMRKHIFAILLMLGTSTPASSQELSSEIATDIQFSSSIGDTAVIDQSKLLVEDSAKLLVAINSADEIDKTKYIPQIRTLRLKITKRAPLIRTALESLRSKRENLRRDFLFNKNFLSRSSSGFSFATDDTEEKENESKSDIEAQIEAIKSAITQAKSEQPPNQIKLTAMDAELRVTEKRLSSIISAEEKAEADRSKRQASLEARLKETQLQITNIEKSINDGESLTRELDENLNMLDDVSGALLQTSFNTAEYTDRSTLVFAVLVGGVIIGFFGIAFRSQSVRDAIFTGESGIQFVTMFSLVIAIILFGVLKILEGRELAALLGGLSGYILGRGSQNQNNTPQPG